MFSQKIINIKRSIENYKKINETFKIVATQLAHYIIITININNQLQYNIQNEQKCSNLVLQTFAFCRLPPNVSRLNEYQAVNRLVLHLHLQYTIKYRLHPLILYLLILSLPLFFICALHFNLVSTVCQLLRCNGSKYSGKPNRLPPKDW